MILKENKIFRKMSIVTEYAALMAIHFLYKDRIEASIPLDHDLSSLGKPRDAKWGSTK